MLRTPFERFVQTASLVARLESLRGRTCLELLGTRLEPPPTGPFGHGVPSCNRVQHADHGLRGALMNHMASVRNDLKERATDLRMQASRIPFRVEQAVAGSPGCR